MLYAKSTCTYFVHTYCKPIDALDVSDSYINWVQSLIFLAPEDGERRISWLWGNGDATPTPSIGFTVDPLSCAIPAW